MAEGQARAVLARGKMNSCLVKFEDGLPPAGARSDAAKCRPMRKGNHESDLALATMGPADRLQREAV
jgi:hypothetical protein